MATNEDINRTMTDEENMKNAYNEFRKKKGLPAVEFPADGAASTTPAHKVQLCLDCLLECFKARRVEEADVQLDEVSAYRGSIMQGIGLTKHGRYARKLGDEMGIQKKRPFDNNMHALSKGF